jgi:4-aminobutyrate aminotransferase/(S)-3-amino-2-methylpropionate transaminase
MGMTLTAKVMPYKQGMGPFAPEVYRLPFAYPYRCPTGGTYDTCGDSCADYALDEMHKHIGEENIAAVVIEPIQGEGGFIVPAAGFVKRIADFCREHGIVFIADEIQTGMGRAGRWFAIEDEGVEPDIILSAKSLGGGLPISAVTGRTDLMDAVHVGGLGGTYGGNPVAAAAALAVLDQMEAEGLLERSLRIGERIRTRFEEMRSKHEIVGDVRGRGAMNAMELVTDRVAKTPADAATGAIIKRCLENGVIVISAGTYNNVVRLLPPLTIEDGLLDEGLDVLDEAIGAATA